MMKSSMSVILLVASHYCASTTLALSINTTPKSSSTSNNALPSTMLSRRGAVMGGAAALVGAGLATLPNLAAAAETTTDLSSYSDLPSGIKYLILKEGKGEKPVRSQQIYTKYTLWSGGFPEDAGSTQIDSITGFVAPFPVIVGVGKVIKGWDLALLDMKLGEVRRLVIPSEAGYGAEAEYEGALPPNSTLYYSVEIVYMNKAPTLTNEQLQWMVENPV